MNENTPVNVLILQGSPRKEGNTVQLTSAFAREMENAGCECRTFFLYDMDIRSCTGCRSCESMRDGFGCSQKDSGMWEIADAVLAADLVVLATPIYSWFCTPPMKAVLDRLVYGMNKFFGTKAKEEGPAALMEGKKLALIMTCGYRPERGADLMEEGVRRFCRHSRMRFLGALTEQNTGYDHVFMTAEKEAHAKEFACRCLKGAEECTKK